MTSSLMEQLLNGIFMCKEVRDLPIICDVGKTSKGGQKIGDDTQMVYYLALTTHI